MGDPAGIGPEIVVKSLADPEVYRRCRPLIIGDSQVLALALRSSQKVRPILNPAQARYIIGSVDVLHLPVLNYPQMPKGRPSKISGIASYGSVTLSVELALTRLVQGVVHAPISKTAWKEAGVRYPGHTELLADLCGVKNIAMAIASGALRTVLVTRHIPLAQVPKHINKEEISIALYQAVDWMKSLGIRRPKIAVCALNPHAGEGGLLGREEIRVVAPAVRFLQNKIKGATIVGPLPADSAYRDHKHGVFDCLITQYHDQSLVPLKLHDSRKLINISLGLPFPRTSPGHGTAFDIAGKNKADPTPMKEAIFAAASMCR